MKPGKLIPLLPLLAITTLFASEIIYEYITWAIHEPDAVVTFHSAWELDTTPEDDQILHDAMTNAKLRWNTFLRDIQIDYIKTSPPVPVNPEPDQLNQAGVLKPGQLHWGWEMPNASGAAYTRKYDNGQIEADIFFATDLPNRDKTALHEIGHTIGLLHPRTPGSTDPSGFPVPHPTYSVMGGNYNNPGSNALTKFDVEYAGSLYGIKENAPFDDLPDNDDIPPPPVLHFGPSITITDPVQSEETHYSGHQNFFIDHNQNTITIYGSTIDADELYVQMGQGGDTQSISPPEFQAEDQLFGVTLELEPGSNYFRFVASNDHPDPEIDEKEFSGNIYLYITYNADGPTPTPTPTPTPDPPILTVTDPEDEDELENPEVTATGEAEVSDTGSENNASIRQVQYRLPNASQWSEAILNYQDGSWEAPFQALEGTHDYLFRCRDSRNLYSEPVSLTLTYQSPLPSIALTSPTENPHTTDDSLTTIKGTVEGPNPIRRVYYTEDGRQKMTRVTNNEWTIFIPNPRGADKEITIRAEDIQGGESESIVFTIQHQGTD